MSAATTAASSRVSPVARPPAGWSSERCKYRVARSLTAIDAILSDSARGTVGWIQPS